MKINIVGGPLISAHSRRVIEAICLAAGLKSVIVSSVSRTVPKQARIMFDKHVAGSDPANYRNPHVGTLLNRANMARGHGLSDTAVVQQISDGIKNIKGGPESVSNHIVTSPFIEVFDIAHFKKGKDGKRVNYMSDFQASKFLDACRKRFPNPIVRLGHSLKIHDKNVEFFDDRCFHFEILHPLKPLDPEKHHMNSHHRNIA